MGSCRFCWRFVHTFPWYLKSNWSNDFGHAETVSGVEKRVVLRNELFFALKVEWEYNVWTKIRFLAIGFFLFTCGNFILFFTVYSVFWVKFLKRFPYPLMVHSRPSFLFESNFHFSLAVFSSHAAFWHWFCFFFKLLWSVFFKCVSQFTHSPF